MSIKIKIKKLHENAIIPKYQSSGAVGFDLHTLLNEGNKLGTYYLYPGETVLLKTGISVEIPEGYELQIRSRSGLSLKHNIIVLNSPGTIDSDYRGEIGIILHNASQDWESDPGEAFEIRKGDRIAQGVICPIIQAEFEEVTELTETERGEGGFGSTNK